MLGDVENVEQFCFEWRGRVDGWAWACLTWLSQRCLVAELSRLKGERHSIKGKSSWESNSGHSYCVLMSASIALVMSWLSAALAIAMKDVILSFPYCRCEVIDSSHRKPETALSSGSFDLCGMGHRHGV